MPNEYAFEMATSAIRFGIGVTREVGAELADLGRKHVLVFTDPNLRALPPVAAVIESLEEHKIRFSVFDQVCVEPSDESFREATTTAQSEDFDAFVAVGGGSTIDTAKAANLYSSYPAEFLAYVNPPIGRGLPIPGPLKPLIAIPTTAGTGSETTGVAIFDFVQMKAKTGIAHRRLRPTLGLVDPDNTRTLPSAVAASSGLDVLSHAVESYTAIPFQQRARPERPLLRPAYQGSNPISDMWSLEALRLVGAYLCRAVADPGDDDARTNMLLAASYAGIGFGNAGVHLPHGMSYPVAGTVRNYRPPGYRTDHPLVPHGISVIVNAPAVFRFTSPACPERHLKAAELLGANVSCAKLEDAGRILADQIVTLMQELKVPNGLRALGYESTDIPALVKGTLPQHRVTKLSPRPAGPDELARLFEESMTIW
ncbi:MAG TPA: hydroxyacid-oxoacid transhydrogenase [Candidatus Acidoferrales bacterium]|jgi:hydroxyacid-oxoacid transhydrogenase|nr:hydroxyacid-oxoacid transhydrogenase [Candidatus Acidoferrales bacterium]